MEITREQLLAMRADFVEQKRRAIDQAATTDGGIQALDMLLAHLETPVPEPPPPPPVEKPTKVRKRKP